MASLALGVRFNSAAGGTGDFVASSAVQGYRNASGALIDGKTYRYRAESADLSQWEYGYGVWINASSTLARTTVSFSSTGSKVSFSAAPQVAIIPFVEDILAFDDAMSLTDDQKTIARLNIGSPALGDWVGMSGGTIVASASSGSLTISIKTFSGNNPSSVDPVFFYFRNSTLSLGDYSRIPVTTALSVVIGSTKTLGALNSSSLRIWISAHNNAGTVQLGAINFAAANSVFFPPEARNVATAVPGNSSQTFYTTSAISVASPWRLIGHCEWLSLTTAGTWVAPDIIQLFGPGIKKPGDVVQEIFVTGSTSTTSSTSLVALGTSASITPTSGANFIDVSVQSEWSINSTGSDNQGLLIMRRGGSTAVGHGHDVGSFGISNVFINGISTLTSFEKPNSTSNLSYQIFGAISGTNGSCVFTYPSNRTSTPVAQIWKLREIMA